MRDCSRGSFGSTRGLGEKAAHAFCGMRCPDQVNKPSLDPPLKAFHPLTVHLVLLFLRGRFALWPFFEHLKQQGNNAQCILYAAWTFPNALASFFYDKKRMCLSSTITGDRTTAPLKDKTKQSRHATICYNDTFHHTIALTISCEGVINTPSRSTSHPASNPRSSSRVCSSSGRRSCSSNSTTATSNEG